MMKDISVKGVALGFIVFVIVYSIYLVLPGQYRNQGQAVEIFDKNQQFLPKQYQTIADQASQERTLYNVTKIRFSHIQGEHNYVNINEIDLQKRREDIQKLAPELFEQFPEKFVEEFKNPCWYQNYTLRCVPYFYLIGMPKCGTTDLWDKLVRHPQVQGAPKEPHWWSRRRLGWKGVPIHGPQVQRIRKMTGTGDDRPLEWYLNWYSTFSVQGIKRNKSSVFGDGSVSTSWDIGRQWQTLFPNASEPPYVLADLIHALQPNAKIIVILREPVSRHYSGYLYCKGKNAQAFHTEVLKNLKCQTECERRFSARYCAYTQPECKLFRGMYYFFLNDWIQAYGRDNVHVVMLSDWMEDSINEYKKLTEFLEIDNLSDEQIRQITTTSVKNSQSKRKDKAGPILANTKKLLEDFYRPWNQKLAELLNDERYRWDY